MASSNFIVLYDACVLYPAPVRDFLMRVALETELFKPIWSNQIHDEWSRNLHAKDPIKYPLKKLQKVIELMNSAFPDSTVEDYESMIDQLQLPDENDRHVLAAAIIGRADVIVTSNLKDFPEPYLFKWNIKPKSADDFTLDLWQLEPEGVLGALEKQQQALKNPPKTLVEVMSMLENQNPGLRKSMAQIKKYA